jgi:hypothetical protein
MSSSNKISSRANGGYPAAANSQAATPVPSYSFGVTGSTSNQLVYTPNTPVLSWSIDVVPTFTEMENGQLVKATLEPESTISAIESMRIQQLISCISSYGTAHLGFGAPKPVSYIRTHNLERHFRFTV